MLEKVNINAKTPGKIALVTGSARRIGAAIVRALHADEMDVMIHYRSSEDAAQQLADDLNTQRADSAAIVAADLGAPDAMAQLIQTTVGWKDRLDILVNNASSFYPTPLQEISESAWNDLMASNLKAPLFLARHAAPHLRKTHGNIVNIVDIHGRRPLRDHHIYGAAKAGLAMLTKSLAKDLAPDICVNGIAPGAIAWPEDGMSEQTKEQILKQVPLGRVGNPADIANAVEFLVTNASFITGQVIPIDGGRSIGW